MVVSHLEPLDPRLGAAARATSVSSIAARTSAAPASVRPRRDSPATSTPNAPAKTGSIVMTTAARVGARWACAHVCTTNASAVAAIAVTATAPHTPASGGGASPPAAGAATAHNAVVVASWTTASPKASWEEDHSPRPTMWQANATAQPTVSSSPPPIDQPRSDIRASPTVASATATHAAAPTERRSSTPARSGVNTTNRPVMKPETDAGVVRSPTVCAT